MFTKKPLNCPITDNKESKLIYVFKKPPFGETKFKIKGSKVYLRELWQFLPSKHLISVNHMNIDTSYEGSYVEATYQNNEKLKSTFKKIISLPNNKSDNKGRVKIIKSFASNWFKLDEKPNLLDIGSGLGVFPYEIEKLGWRCLSIDPDKNSVKHIKEIGINALCGDFRKIKPIQKFNIITLNKVLEHILNPIDFLNETKKWLSERGFVYIELPDGEASLEDNPKREEFFIEHIHIFSIDSTISLIRKAGYLVHTISRIKEPSGKYTIRAFIFPRESLKFFINK